MSLVVSLLPAVLVAVLAGAGVVLLVPPPVALSGARAGSGRRGLYPPLAVLVAALIVVPALWTQLTTERFILVVLLAGVAFAVGRLVRRRRASRVAQARSEMVLGVCESLASDLAAGQPPLRSLDRVAREWPDLAPVAAAGQMGADVPAALRELAKRPGARQLRVVAATWQVANETGAGLASAIGQAAEAIRQERRTARLVAGELAAAHATAQMLAALPFGVLLLGAGIGGDPFGFLTGTAPGLGCLAVGLALCVAGLTWLERIADAVLGR